MNDFSLSYFQNVSEGFFNDLVEQFAVKITKTVLFKTRNSILFFNIEVFAKRLEI